MVFSVHIQDEEYFPARVHTELQRGFGLRELKRLEVNAEAIELDVTLEEAASLRGQVRTSEGLVVPGLQVRAELPPGNHDPMARRARTALDESGAFELQSLLPHPEYLVSVRSTAGAVLWTQVEARAPGYIDIEIPAASELTVQLHGLPRGTQGNLLVSFGGHRVIQPLTPDARVEFAALPAGSCVAMLLVLANGSRHEFDGFELEPGLMSIEREVLAQTEAPSIAPSNAEMRSVRVQLVDSSGQLWNVARLWEFGLETSDLLVELRGQGPETVLLQPEFAGDPNHPLELAARVNLVGDLEARLVRPEESAPQLLDDGAAASPVLLDLRETQQPVQDVRFLARFPDGSAGHLARLRLESLDGTRVLDRHGSHADTILKLVPGTYAYQGLEVGGQTALGKVEVLLAKTPTEVLITFEEALLVRGELTPPGSRAAIWLKKKDQGGLIRHNPAEPAADGSYRLLAPGPGNYLLTVLTLEGNVVRVRRRSVHLREATTVIDFDLGEVPTGLARLKVKGSQLAHLQVACSEGPLFAGHVNGAPMTLLLVAGTYEVRAYPRLLTADMVGPDLRQVQNRTVTLTAGSEQVLDFDL